MIISEIASVSSVEASPDGRFYASGHDDGTIRVYALFSGELVWERRIHMGAVTAVRWSIDARQLASSSGDGSVSLVKASDGASVFLRERAHKNWAVDVCFDSTRDRLLTVGGVEEAILKGWDRTGAGVEVAPVSGLLANQGNRLCLSPDGRRLVVSYWRRDALDSIEEGKESYYNGWALIDATDRKMSLVSAWQNAVQPREYDVGISWQVSFSPDGRLLATSYTDDVPAASTSENRQFRSIAIYEAATATLTKLLPAPRFRRITAAHFVDENRMLLVALESDRWEFALQLYTIAAARPVITLFAFAPTSEGRGSNADICPAANGTLFVSGGSDGCIRLWDGRLWVTPDGQPALPIAETHALDVNALTADPTAWPRWFRSANIEAPQGRVPNPGFGEQVRLHERKVLCSGVQIHGAEGLEHVIIGGLESDLGTRARRAEVIAWFRARGAAQAPAGSNPRRSPAPESRQPVARRERP